MNSTSTFATTESVRLPCALLTIILVTRLCGRFAARVGQPTVVGEIVGGILLGPSIFGKLVPGVHDWLLSSSVIPPIQVLGGLGVVVFVFGVGYELPWMLLRSQSACAVIIGLCAVVVPLMCGVLVGHTVLADAKPSGVSSFSYALFIGVAMAVTALPVLARVLEDLGLLNRPLGAVALAAAAVVDVSAWAVLGVVTTANRSSPARFLGTLGAVLAICAALVLIRRSIPTQVLEAASSESVELVVVSAVLAASAVTVAIGVHAIFGAFLAGVSMPPGARIESVIDGLMSFARLLLLPLFFAVVGLGMNLDFLSHLTGLWWLVVVLVVAVAAKLFSTTGAAMLCGLSREESLSLGFMLTCRGLTELVVLRVGRDRGIIGPDLFAVFVVMTVITTAMVGPAVRRTLAGDRPAQD